VGRGEEERKGGGGCAIAQVVERSRGADFLVRPPVRVSLLPLSGFASTTTKTDISGPKFSAVTSLDQLHSK